MRRREGSTRKVRSDKKRDVQPVVSLELKKQLFRFSFLCKEPMKDAGERLCAQGAVSPLIMDDINQFFRRNLSINNHHYMGYLERPRLTLLQSNKEKITIKFPQDTFESLFNLAFALDLPLNQTAAVLIKRTLNNREFMHEYIQHNLRHLHEREKAQLESFLKGVWGFK